MQNARGMQCMQGDAVHEESIGAAVRRGLLRMHVAEGQWCVQSARGVAEHAECRELEGSTGHAE